MGLTKPRASQIFDLDYKQATRVITVSNVTLTGGAPAVVDGVSLNAGDRVLVTGQSTGSENGLYAVSVVGVGEDGTWVRTSDGNEDGEISAGMIIMVTEGTTYADTQWKLTTDDPIDIGVTSLTFVINILSDVGGANTQVQFNDAGTLGGFSSNFVFDKTANVLSVTGNITGTYILGDGSQLSNLPGGGITYTAYTASATLTADQGAIADTSGGAFTLTLPASPSTGNQVIIVDGTDSFGTNNLTVGRNSSTIEGATEDLVCDIDGVSVTFIYNGTTWAIYAQIGAVSGTVVTETGTQTLTNKTLTNPTINNYTEGTVAIGTVTTSHTFDLTSGTLQTATLTASTACTFTMPTASSGKSFLLVLNQAATTGNGTATFTSVLWAGGSAPTVTAAAGSIDMFSFVSDGTSWYGAVTQDFQ
jgi:hypothetical protein